MKRILAGLAIAFLAVSPAQAQKDSVQAEPVGSAELTPAVSKVADFAKSTGLQKVMLYGEIDDKRPDGGTIVGMGVVGQPPGVKFLIMPTPDQQRELTQAVSNEALASGKEGWRKILIVVEDGVVSVRRGPRTGPIEGFNDRMKATVDLTFPGHS